MKNIPRWAWWVGGLSGFLLFAAAAMLYGNDWWLSGILTVSVVAWLAGVLAAIYSSAERRAPVLGAVAAGFLYVLLAVGPWFNANVSPWLVTTRALVHIETKWLGRESQQQLVYQTIVPTGYTGAGYSGIGFTGGSGFMQPQVWPNYSIATTTQAASGLSTFVAMGHWLCGWLSAALGMLAAAWMVRRGRKPAARQDSSGGAGENPFGPPLATPNPSAETSP